MINMNIEKLSRQVHEGVFENDGRELFAGAGIVVADRMPTCEQSCDGGIQYVATGLARELSSVIYSLRDIFDGKIDSLSKYQFYGRLAEAATAYLDKNRDGRGVLDAVLDEARLMWTELEY